MVRKCQDQDGAALGLGSVGNESLLPFGRLLFGGENDVWAGGDFKGQSLAQFDLRQQHVQCVARLYAQTGKDLLGLAQTGCGNAGAGVEETGNLSIEVEPRITRIDANSMRDIGPGPRAIGKTGGTTGGR